MARRLLLGFILLAWAAAVAAGWRVMTRFALTPGAQAAAPAVLPRPLADLLPPARPRPAQLFVVLHPQCSCSGATVRELVRIVGQSGAASRVSVNLLVYQPRIAPAHWAASSLPALAAPLHPRVLRDPDGEYARALGASTSGEVLLYSGAGRLLSQGGITPERGETGASPGGARLLRALQHGRSEQAWSSIFGCPLFAHAREASW